MHLNHTKTTAHLRSAAAHASVSDAAANSDAIPPQAMMKVIHELRVFQIELETLNDELRHTQAERNMAQSCYSDFYDREPVSYVTVSKQGLILSCNLTAAELLGVDRKQLTRQDLGDFIEQEDQDTFYRLCTQLLETDSPKSRELRMRKHDGSHFFASMYVIAIHDDNGAPALRLVLIDITAHKRAEEELRIAAVAFDAQEAIVVMDSQRHVLRVNRAFTQISGYGEQELLGKTTTILRSKRHPVSIFEDIWRRTIKDGREQGCRWLKHKNGDDLFVQGTTTAIKNQQGQITHYVITFSDQTLKHQQDQQRVQHESAHRDALVREVHHRIKNNLQGIGGLLRQCASQKPEIAEQIQLVAGHLSGISVIHGLQGRHDKSLVRLCEMTREIAQATSVLWQTTISIDIPTRWVFRVVAEREAVSMALVLNELLVNAVKHGGKAQGHISVTLRQGQGIEGVEVSILNAGYLQNYTNRRTEHHHGLQLVELLRPRVGLSVTLTQRDNQVQTLLQITAPVITLDIEN